jgi:ribosome-associated translation inhibitor RaiA
MRNVEMLIKAEFQGFEPSTHLRELVESNIHKFEARGGQITSCNVVVRAPGAHHRMGEHYAVSIRLELPNGRQVNVGSSASDVDRRHANVVFAITDSFRKAMRQLRDETRRLQVHVKQHGKISAGGNQS